MINRTDGGCLLFGTIYENLSNKVVHDLIIYENVSIWKFKKNWRGEIKQPNFRISNSKSQMLLSNSSRVKETRLNRY